MKNSALVFVFIFFGNFLTNAQEVIWDQSPFTTANLAILNRGAKTNVRITNPIEVSGNVVVPKNVTLAFSGKGMLRIKDEATQISIEGPIQSDKNQIFDLSARGVTTYRFESVSNIKFKATSTFYPEWWGILPNVIPGKNGDRKSKARHHTYLKDMMLDVAASGGGEIVFSEGVYYIRDIVLDFDDVTLRGQGKETILRFDRENYKYSTRRGGIFTIQGPTTEKYYNKEVPNGIHIAGNYLYDTEQKTVRNIVVKDLAIEWHPDAAKEDPSMNGLTIVNASNVSIDNVHINMFGANRAFYVGTIFDGDVTEDISIKNSSCVNSRTGVFILHGYRSENPIRKKMALGNISIENNHFKVVDIPTLDIQHKHIVEEYLDRYGTGVYFIGNEFTSNTTQRGESISRSIGKFHIKDNIIENADFGIRCWFPGKDEDRDYIHNVVIEGNTFLNFNYIGVFSTFKEVQIKDNTFQSKQLSLLPMDVKNSNEEEFIASAIQIAKAPYKNYKTKLGPEKVTISSNHFEGCYLGTIPVILQPKRDGVMRLDGNTFTYDKTCKKPSSDIRITTNNRKYRSKRATLILSENQEIVSNDSPQKASIDIDSKRSKHITIIEE